MSEQNMDVIVTTTERLATAAAAIEQVLVRLEASQQQLHSKIDRIVAAIDEQRQSHLNANESVEQRLAELERENRELKAQSAAGRKTLPPFVSMVLAKNGIDEPTASVEAGVLDKALASLTLEQRVAVKSEMARAGLIS